MIHMLVEALEIHTTVWRYPSRMQSRQWRTELKVFGTLVSVVMVLLFGDEVSVTELLLQHLVPVLTVRPNKCSDHGRH
jgi:hypothetical protein